MRIRWIRCGMRSSGDLFWQSVQCMAGVRSGGMAGRSCLGVRFCGLGHVHPSGAWCAMCRRPKVTGSAKWGVGLKGRLWRAYLGLSRVHLRRGFPSRMRVAVLAGGAFGLVEGISASWESATVSSGVASSYEQSSVFPAVTSPPLTRCGCGRHATWQLSWPSSGLICPAGG